jgi:hypothetical protein
MSALHGGCEALHCADPGRTATYKRTIPSDWFHQNCIVAPRIARLVRMFWRRTSP